MKKKICLCAGVLALLVSGCSKPENSTSSGDNGGTTPPVSENDGRTPFENEVGKPLSAWGEGYLDIHAINSARGECTFFIMPDGTTLCCDAGEIGLDESSHPKVDPKPNAETRAFNTYGTYIRHFLPSSIPYIDYMLLTHFHNDHFGTGTEKAYTEVTRLGKTWRLTGLMALYDMTPFNKLIDRAYSSGDTEYKFVGETGTSVSAGLDSYASFVHWARSAKALKVERAVNGSTSQIKLVNKPGEFPDFKVQINAVNGEYWDGTASVDAYGASEKVAENGNSISFLLSYGKFDYLTSGDAGANTKIENNLAKSIGRKIEAMKAHHHFSWDTMSPTSMKIYQPKVVVSQSFYDHQPDMGHSWMCGGIMYEDDSSEAFQKAWASYGSDDDKYWYFTNIHPKTISVYPSEVAKMRSQNGHVVIRVSRDGDFYVYVLDDTDFNYTVKKIDGPFKCHEE